MGQLECIETILTDVGTLCFTFDMPGLLSLQKLMGPGVYIISNREEALYIGMAGNVLQRISDPNHEAFRASMKEASRLEVVIAKSEAHARGIETELIRDLQPKYNIRGTIPSTELRQFTKDFTHALRQSLG